MANNRLLRRLVAEPPLTRSSRPSIEWLIWGGVGGSNGGDRANAVESVVTQMYQEAFVGSSIENGTTIITFDLRLLDFQRPFGSSSTIYWSKESYHVDVHELSTFHNPIQYRFILAQGYSFDEADTRRLRHDGATREGSSGSRWTCTPCHLLCHG